MSKFNFKKVLTLALSVAIIGSQGITAFAAVNNPSLEANSGTSEFGANILDRTVERVVVPTNLKIALNPNGYNVIKRYVKVDQTTVNTPVSTKLYYTYDGTKYDLALENGKPALTAWASNTEYYEAVTDNAKVVSLNYGIVNKSTEAKIVNVDLKVSYPNTVAANKDITFVTDIADARAKVEGGNAEPEELNMYLSVKSSDAKPTANTYALATTHAATNVYYVYNNATNAFSKAGTQPTFADTPALLDAQDTADLSIRSQIVADPTIAEADINDSHYYVETTTIGPKILAAHLADVFMNASSVETKIEPKTDDSDAELKAGATWDYYLTAADYQPRKYMDITPSDTPATLQPKLEIATIGDAAAFTITGDLNKIADWTKAKSTVINFEPIYTISDVETTPTPIDGTYNQIAVNRGPKVAMTAAGVITVSNLTATQNYANASTSINLKVAGANNYLGADTNVEWDVSGWDSASGGTIIVTLKPAWTSFLTGKKAECIIELSDGTTITTGEIQF